MNCTKKRALRFIAVAAGMVTAMGTKAQQPDRYKYDELAAKYKGEHSVYTNVTHRLEIKEEDNMLWGYDNQTSEKLYLTNVSLSNDNNDFFAYIGGHVTDLEGVTFVPDKKTRAYKEMKKRYLMTASGINRYMLDNSMQYVVSYTNLEKGTITRSSYSFEFAGMNMLPTCEFQREAKVEKETFEVVVPPNVKMGFLLRGGDTSVIRRSVTERNGMTVYTFTAQNLPAVKNYNYIPSHNYAVPHVIPYVISYKANGAKKDTLFTASKDQLYKHLYQYVKGINIKVSDALNKKTDEITAHSYSQRDKAVAIYKWVQNNLHYFGFEQGMEGQIPRQADTVFTRMYGDCKDMSSILMAMCRRAGIQAHFAWIGTDDIPYLHTDIPSPMLYNHMICALKLGGQWEFVDGTDNHLPFGQNRSDIQGKEAMVAIDAHHYEIVKIPATAAARNMLNDNTIITFSNDTIVGSVNQHYTGYPAWQLIHKLDNVSTRKEKEKFVRNLTSRGSNKYMTTGYSVDAREEGDMDVTVNTDFTVGNYVQHVGKACFVNMNLCQSKAIDYINDEDRNVPYYLPNTNSTRESVTLNVPKGFKVSSLPKPVSGGVDGLWSYKISYSEDKKTNKVVMTKELVMDTRKVDPKQFDAHNKLLSDLEKSYKETVVLTAKK